MRRVALLLATAALLAAPAAAGAYVAPGATIVSASAARQEQGDDATSQVALSADGRYAVFQTRARNFFADDDADPPGRTRFGGIFRRDLQSGALELVAYGDLRDEQKPTILDTRGAQNPSVSADGRWVAFSTGYPLDPLHDTNGAVDVYVRDMTRPADGSQGPAYELVSARDGGDDAASYALLGADRPGANPGSDVTQRSAISADGRYVIFKTPLVASDLPAASAVTVPGGQIFVRDRRTRRTVLITRDGATGDPVGGSIAAATISRDGSTVLWVGRNAPAQTRFLNGEFRDESSEYLLWRRWDDAAPATRRVTGGVDPDDPACDDALVPYVPSLVAAGPCYGPLSQAESYLGALSSAVPGMSADGRRVLFLTSASPRGVLIGVAADLFLTDMSAGVTRKVGTTELTREGQGTAAGAGIDGLDLSADGAWAAVATYRTQFPFAATTLTDTARTRNDARELYLLDLGTRRLERAVRAQAGGDTDGSVDITPSLSADGRRVAFISDATNLFYGDANGRADAFVVDRLDAPPADPAPPDPGDAAPVVDQTPTTAGGDGGPRLPITVGRGRRGTVTLAVVAPGAGRLEAVARGRALGADGRPRGRARTLARGTARAPRARTVRVTLRLSAQQRARLRSAGRLVAQAEVRFVPARGAARTRRVTVEFRP